MQFSFHRLEVLVVFRFGRQFQGEPATGSHRNLQQRGGIRRLPDKRIFFGFNIRISRVCEQGRFIMAPGIEEREIDLQFAGCPVREASDVPCFAIAACRDDILPHFARKHLSMITYDRKRDDKTRTVIVGPIV